MKKHRVVNLGRMVLCTMLALSGVVAVACGQKSGEPEAGVVSERLTASFRVGEAGYTSADDVSISNQSGGNGAVDRTATQVLAWKKTGTDAYEISSLIRFNNLTLPVGAQVTAAQLTLTFENWWTGFTLRGYYVKNPWNAASSAPLGWLYRDSNLSWATPGAKGVGTDLVAGASFSNSTWVGNGDEVKTFDLDPSIVQGWIDNPSSNQGVLLVNNESDDKYLRIYASEDSVLTRRPKLTITYSTGSGGGGSGGGGSGGSGGSSGGTGSHPRIFLDSGTLSGLRAKAQAASPQWVTLRNACNAYLNGVTKSVCYPPQTPTPDYCNPYPNLPDVGEGYQGDDYLAAVMNLGLCYQIGLGTADVNTTNWGARGADVLSRMTEFTAHERDDGYGIRNYGVGMALGFDYLYPALSSSVKTQVVSALNAWLSWFDGSGLARNEPHANYFAGYYAAKAYTGLATEGDNASAVTTWSDFRDRLHWGTASGAPHGGVASYYTAYLTGGGWYESWQYGNLAVQNMSLPALAARTAKNLDLIQDPTRPYLYPLQSASHLMQFTWPSRDQLDDRDTVHSGSICPSTTLPTAQLLATASTLLTRWNDPLASKFHRFARDARTATGGSGSAPWSEFLFWDDSATESDYSSLPLSYLATNYAAMRSDWSTQASWASLRASAYVTAQASTEQFPDPGALAITRGNLPFLVNPGFLHRCVGGTPSADFETPIHNEVYDGGAQRIFNTFYNGTPPILGFTAVDATPPPATRIASFEDRGGYVLARTRDLEDVFTASANVTLWSRDVLYFRPNLFVVYDRTTVGSTAGDQHMNWHFGPTPALVSSAGGVNRYDVSDSFGFRGALTTLLPANATTLVNVFGSNRLYRVEVRPTSSATDSRWLTVLDNASSASGVRAASLVTSSANVKGALLTASGGNFVALFGAAATGTVSGAVTFTEPAQSTRVVVSDLVPNTAYSVTVQTTGSNHSVTIQPGTGFTTSGSGALYVNIAASGAVSAGT